MLITQVAEAPEPYHDLLAPARETLQSMLDQSEIASAKAEEASRHESQAEAYMLAAEGFADDAATSAQAAANVFQGAGDDSFSVDPETNKVVLHLTVAE